MIQSCRRDTIHEVQIDKGISSGITELRGTLRVRKETGVTQGKVRGREREMGGATRESFDEMADGEMHAKII